MQKTLITAMVPVVSVVEKLVTGYKKKESLDTDSIVTDLMDAVSLKANVSQAVSYKRRNSIRKDIGEKYTDLCSRQTAKTDKLFGDDVDEEIKRIDKTKNLGRNMSSKDKEDKSFLGQGFSRFHLSLKKGKFHKRKFRNNKSTKDSRDYSNHQ